MTAKQINLVLCEVGETHISGIESYSPFCLKVHRGLKYSGLAYERRHEAHPGKFKSLNPLGQVPILLVDGNPLYDSTKILEWIVQTVPEKFRYDRQIQAEANLWEELADTALNGYVIAARWADDRNWPKVKETFFKSIPIPVRGILSSIIQRKLIKELIARDILRAGHKSCWKRFEELVQSLNDRAPENQYWLGDFISTADFSIFGQMQSFRTQLTPWQKEFVESNKRLKGYLDRVDEATR